MTQGTLPAYLAAVIIGRDVFLVGASLAARAHSLGWRHVSVSEFFRIAPRSRQVGCVQSVSTVFAVPGVGVCECTIADSSIISA